MEYYVFIPKSRCEEDGTRSVGLWCVYIYTQVKHEICVECERQELST